MYKEYLGRASFKVDFSVIEPEEAEDLGKGSGTQHQVIHRKHTEEEIHSFMKTRVCLDDEHNGTIPHKSQQMDQEKGDGDPDVSSFHPWDSKEKESVGWKLVLFSTDIFRVIKPALA